ERVRKLPVSIRVFHCLVLPSALMTRAPVGFALSYDPFTLQVLSCKGWSRRDIEETCRWLDDAARSEDHQIPHGGTWKFPRPDRPDAWEGYKADLPGGIATPAAMPGDSARSYSTARNSPREMHDALARIVLEVAGWRLESVGVPDGDTRSTLMLL